MNTQQYTNTQLQLALAKMLPEKLVVETKSAHDNYTLEQSNVRWLYNSLQHQGRGLYVLDTEWLHVCWLVERSLTGLQWRPYVDELIFTVDGGPPKENMFFIYTAAWQQRAIALAKVKGVEIV